MMLNLGIIIGPLAALRKQLKVMGKKIKEIKGIKKNISIIKFKKGKK